MLKVKNTNDMKHKILSMIGAGLLILALASCREQSDTLISYDHQDQIAFSEAENSYAGKFKVMWNALSQNYAMWDYEKENGLDWDDVYDKYLPRYEALDQQKDVTDNQLLELTKEVICPLHDGHMVVKLKNHKTGNYITVFPSEVRNSQRPNFLAIKSASPRLEYYADKKNGEIELDEDGQPLCLEYSTDTEDMLDKFNETDDIGMNWINDSITVLKELTTPTAEQVDMLQVLTELKNELKKVEDSLEGIQLFNWLANRYAYLNIPGFEPIDEAFCNNDIKIKSALLKGNIAYLHFSDFNLSYYLNEEANKYTFHNPSESTIAHFKKVQEVWYLWYNSIQDLHKSGKLGGVIIDVRNNGGGLMSDYQLVMGALLPSGGFEYGKSRYKRGPGRLDYSPLMPGIIATMDDEHAVITEPIVVLSNLASISMAEITALSTKYIDNAISIGQRTWGGLCGLTGNESFSYNYSGHIGEENKTPVYIYLPVMAQFTREGQILDGYGVTPDIEVNLDLIQFLTTGKDTQLDRALQYIRNGN